MESRTPRGWRPVVAAVVAFGVAGPAVGALPAFELRDQNERLHTARLLQRGGKPLLVISGDQRGSDKRIARWHSALRGANLGQVVIRGLVNLEKVPFFVPRSLLRRSLRKSNPRLPVLCDYKGAVFRRLNLAAGGVSVTLFDPGGNKVLQVRGRVSRAGVARVKQALKRTPRGP